MMRQIEVTLLGIASLLLCRSVSAQTNCPDPQGMARIRDDIMKDAGLPSADHDIYRDPLGHYRVAIPDGWNL